MGLKGKLICEKEIKCHGDVFHNLFRHKPHDIATITPDYIHKCDIHEGEFGKSGSILHWEYTHEGKKKLTKVVIDDVNEEKKLVKFKVVEGEILEQYKAYCASVHVDTYGDDHVLTWTLEYEKVKEDVPEPISYLEFMINIGNGIEAHHAN